MLKLDEAFDENAGLYGLSDEDVARVSTDISEENWSDIDEVLTRLNTADLADLLEKVEPEKRTVLVTHDLDHFSADVFAELESEVRRDVLSTLTADQVAGIVSSLDSDDALNLIINLDPLFQKDIIRQLSAKTRLTLEEGLNFPEDSAGRLMQREFVAVPEFWTVGKTIDYLRAAGDTLPTDFFDLIVISPAYHVKGEIPLNRLIRSNRSEKIEQLTLDDIHTIPADMDQEDVALLFQREGLSSAPVVDENDRVLGVITVDDVIDVINEEAQEDILKLAGVEEGDLYRAVFSSTKSRFRWLLINLFTAIMASVVIALFDATIQELVALAVLMPIVASMGGNAGTQAMTVAVRALATRAISGANAWRIIWKETLIGVLNGMAFAVIIGIIAGLWYANPLLGGVIATAMVFNLFVAGAAGAGIPILLSRMGSDPAISSAVVLTTVTDIVGFFAFLGLATIIL